MSQPPQINVSQPTPPVVQKQAKKPGANAVQTSKKAMLSLIFGVSSLVCSAFTGIVAIILGVIALKEINRSRGQLTGGGLAIGGIVVGSFGTVFTALILILVGLLLPAVQQVRQAARRTHTMNNIKILALAMHSYHDVNQHFPDAVPAANAASKLSWRVQLLPFIEENHLYNRFHHDEPWDSPHNLALVEEMPMIFESVNHDLERGKTMFVVPVTRELPNGEYDFENQTMFLPGEKTSLEKVANGDGSGSTIMILEVNPDAAVIWTQPDDWEFDPDHPMRDLGKAWPTLFFAGMADGSVHHLDKDISPETIKALMTSQKGEPIDFIDF